MLADRHQQRGKWKWKLELSLQGRSKAKGVRARGRGQAKRWGVSDSATSNAVELHRSSEILRKLYSELHSVYNEFCGIDRIDRARKK